MFRLYKWCKNHINQLHLPALAEQKIIQSGHLTFLQYTTIKEGQNKINAKCTYLNNNPLPTGDTSTNGTTNTTSRHYSVNVTGVASSTTAIPTKLPSFAIAGKSTITNATTNGGANSTCNGMDVTTCNKLDKLINGMRN